jgi:hypothetical protein
MSHSMTSEAEVLERIRAITARAAQEAAAAAIRPDPHPTPSPEGDRPAEAKPARGAPRHWAETDHDHEEHDDGA